VSQIIHAADNPYMAFFCKRLHTGRKLKLPITPLECILSAVLCHHSARSDTYDLNLNSIVICRNCSMVFFTASQLATPFHSPFAPLFYVLISGQPCLFPMGCCHFQRRHEGTRLFNYHLLNHCA